MNTMGENVYRIGEYNGNVIIERPLVHDFFESSLDFFCTYKIIEKGSFGHTVFEIFLWRIFSYISFFTAMQSA